MRPGVLVVAAALVVAACSSSDPPPSFCASAAASCASPTPCDGTLAASCADLPAAVSSTVLSAAQACLQSGICGVTSCLANAPRNAARSLAQEQLADRYCNVCAPDVDGCIDGFYQNASKLPGPLVLPYSDKVVLAVHDACVTDGIPCRGSFVACATRTITDTVNSVVPAGLATCVLAGFRNDPAATGPGGGPTVEHCTADTCTGCCRDDVCQPGGDISACGTGGAACTTCSGTQGCTNGTCFAACGPENCAGCCVGGTCRVGNEHDACGLAGAACSTCSSDSACSNGQCVDAACIASCASGCCDRGGCHDGLEAGSCGSGGAACTDCGTGRTCSRSKACTLDASALWDFYVASAELPRTNPDGEPWDADGPPDPYLIASTAVHSGRTATLVDTTSPAWATSPLRGISSAELTRSLSFTIEDEDDEDADDYIGGCAVPLTTAVFDGSLQSTSCPATSGGSAVTLYWRIRPH